MTLEPADTPADSLEAVVDDLYDRFRLDAFLSEMIEDASRSYIQKIIKKNGALINGVPCKRPSRSVFSGDAIGFTLPPPPEASAAPEDIPLDVLFEDAHVLVINKPSGLVVHPAPGHYSGTLVNAVMHHCGAIESSGDDPARPGIVHRLDRYTSGVMIVAKTRRAYGALAEQAREHTFDRHYLALVQGEFPEVHGRIVAAVGRSLANPGKMAVTGIRGKDAVTHFHTVERYRCASLLKLVLETGRTHQIRVHMRFAGHPILGDPVYGTDDFRSWAEELQAPLAALEGQALHAEMLGFTHPLTGERLTYTAPPPPDFQAAHAALRAYAGGQ